MAEKETKEKIEEKIVEKEATEVVSNNSGVKKEEPKRENGGEKRVFKKNKRRPNKRRERVRSEFDQKILDIRRVTRVSAGGRRFSFAVTLAAGDKKGRVGIGTGKAGDTALAIEKAFRNAKKNMITVKMTGDKSIPHEVDAKYCSAKVMMMPAKGRGVIAGSAVRDVVNLAGLNDINAKIISGTKNKLNIAQAAVKALNTLKDPKPEMKKSKKDKREDK